MNFFNIITISIIIEKRLGNVEIGSDVLYRLHFISNSITTVSKPLLHLNYFDILL